MFFQRPGRRRNKPYNKGNKGFQPRCSNFRGNYQQQKATHEKIAEDNSDPGPQVFVQRENKITNLKSNGCSSTWNKEDAVEAFELEKQYDKHLSNQFILRFPDPLIHKAMIQQFSPAIVDIRVQFPLIQRFVYIQLDPTANADEVMERINQIPFGGGYLKLERKIRNTNEMQCTPEDIDPFSIFIGNITNTMSVQAIKQLVPLASKLDVGHSRKQRYGRYAFAKFRSAEDARTTYKTLRLVGDRTGEVDLIVRFRRYRGAFGEMKKTIPVVDLTEGEDEKQAIKVEPDDGVQETQAMFEPIDWEKLREEEISRYEEKPDMRQLPVFADNLMTYNAPINPEVSNSELEEILNQIDSEFNYVFSNCDLDI